MQLTNWFTNGIEQSMTRLAWVDAPDVLSRVPRDFYLGNRTNWPWEKQWLLRKKFHRKGWLKDMMLPSPPSGDSEGMKNIYSEPVSWRKRGDFCNYLMYGGVSWFLSQAHRKTGQAFFHSHHGIFQQIWKRCYIGWGILKKRQANSEKGTSK